MALSRIKTWIVETLTAADLNAEFNNILDNALSLISPLTGNLNANNNQITALVLERLGANPTPATEARIFYNTARDFAGVDDSAAIRQLLDAHHGAGLLWGLTLSNGTDATNDINIAAGACVDSTNVAAMRRTAVLVKQLDAAWAVGTNAGGLDTGAIANTTYHVHLIQRVDTGVVDALFSTSATAPTMPTNYTLRRRIGSILRESATIVAFTQDGDLFLRTASILSIDVSNPGTGAVSRVLHVPIGINTIAHFNWRVANNTGGANSLVYFSNGAVNDEAPSGTAAPLAVGLADNLATGSAGSTAYGFLALRANTSAEIRSRLGGSDANTTLRIATLAWEDTRGRMA